MPPTNPKRPKYAFDEKCYELAKYFMEEPADKWREEDRNELAQLIQDTIEDFMSAAETNYAD